jgi:DNA repair ATPase RecN
MKILNLKSENIKGVKVIDITPKDDMVIISGKNGAGKTSALDSIWYILCWKAGVKGTPMPIRKGEKEAEGRITLCEDLTDKEIEQGIKPKPLFIVTRKWTVNNTYLKVTNAEGLVYETPQKLLDGFIGYLSFDPREFTRMSEKEQRDLLIKITGFDVTSIEEKINSLREERRLQGQTVKLLSGEREEINPDILPKELVNTNELNKELEKAMLANNIYNNTAEELEENKRTLLNLESRIKTLKENIINEENHLKENEHINVDSIKEKIEGAEEANEIFRANERNKEADIKQKNAEGIYDGFTKGIKDYTEELEQGLKKSWSKIPDQKLSLTEQGIAYNGIPYSQISFSEQLRVAMKIAMALNPKLRVIRIADYSLLDEESKKAIRQMSKDEHYQVWAETVDETGEIGFYIENGEIANK